VKLNFYPEYHCCLATSLTPEEAIAALSVNIMERQIVTFGPLSAFADGYSKKDRYFEGWINGAEFEINRKSYFSGNWKPADAIISGSIKVTGNNSKIEINIHAPDWESRQTVIMFPIFFLIVCILAVVTKEFSFVLFIIILPFMLLARRFAYIHRAKKDKAHLMDILNASETVGSTE
jgi:hypothetical protein